MKPKIGRPFFKNRMWTINVYRLNKPALILPVAISKFPLCGYFSRNSLGRVVLSSNDNR